MSRNLALFLILLAVLIISPNVLSQISIGGEPVSFTKSARGDVQSVTMPEVDVEAYMAEDLRDGKDVPYRFGAPIDVHYDLDNSGTWETLADGTKLWRLKITSTGAYSLNLLYDEFWLPEGGRLFLYNAERSTVLGAFTSANNKDHREFATAPTKGDEVTLEYSQPAGVTETPIIKVSRVVHAYHNLFDGGGIGETYDFGDAGSCNNNVNCSVGDDWRDQIRSVAMILTSGGFRLCSGSMVNNVRRDGTPYFLTANHCLGGETTWIFMWNYESPTCSNIDGPTFMTVQGSTLRATSTTSDFALLQLTEAPPDSYMVYFAGWSAENVTNDSSCGIHHPQGDIKKISFDYDFNQLTDYLGNGAGTTHIRIVAWNDGTTEPGSSGSPLFNKQKRVIGQLHGGFASCTSITSDWYGKFARSWTGGGTNSTSLMPWLDPDNTGVLELDGYDPNNALAVEVDTFYNTADTLNDYEILSTIQSDTGLVADELLLHYTISSVTYLDTLSTTGNPDEYHGYIPAQSPNTSVSYYITVENLRGDVDTSVTITFQVIGYAVSLDPPVNSSTGAVDDTVLYSLTVTNNGAIADNYNLAIGGDSWDTEILDATGTFPVSSSGTLINSQTFGFKVRVIVPVSNYGDNDLITVTAQSTGNGSISDQTVLTTVSAGQPLAAPLYEAFEDLSLDPATWVVNVNGEVSTVGINEPTPPYSLNLNGNPSTRDTVLSQAIDLAGQDSVVLSYYYQRTGGGNSPETGDDLLVEYFNNSGQWIVLQQHLGSGPDMTQFEKVSVLLGSDALHSAFRIRLRNIASPAGLSDDWFVDDLRVDGPPVADVAPLSLNVFLPGGDSTERNIVITNDGQGELSWDASVIFLDKRNKLFEQLTQVGEVQPASFQYPEGFFDYEDIKGFDDPRDGYPVEKDAGGPDAFGYVWVDSDELGGPVFSWVDISGTGTDVISALNDDNFSGPYNIGFNFPFYTNNYNQLYVGSNGIIGFAADSMMSRFKT
ncbi:MAG TPA: serine protease, partial [candidate division Zixibacteria bacterium]|nr:serine protease [candidate division Zixibacteria bacterium]